MPPSRVDQSLTLAVLAMLIVGCFFVLQPFITALVWAAILCTTTWPLYWRVTARLRDRSGLSALVMVVLLALLMIAPFIVVGATIADNAALVAQWGRQMLEVGPPDPPAWVAQLPLIGTTVAAYWSSMAHDTAQLLGVLGEYVEPLRKFLVASGASVVGAILQMTLAIFIAWFMFRDGHAIAEHLMRVAQRIAGDRGKELASVAAATVRGVVLGLLGTALVQGVVAGIGFWIAGIQAAPLLGLLTFFLSPVPIGPPLVWVPAGLWLIQNGQTGWGLFVLLWGTFAVSTIDNIIKPLIISRGVDLPFVLVLLGVLGGAIAFGFIGIFLGPVLLAVGYALLMEWAASRGRIELVTPADADRNGATRGVVERMGADVREPASRLRD
ncbi:MAG TPA: AI-2E family transporter [Casimicrobiaceae bacterium]|nr:AI-2E family transporter [Casimicrobiaceae bacterium]